MGKILEDPLSSASTSSNDDCTDSVQNLTRDLFRLATCCAIERFPFITNWKTNEENVEIENLLTPSKTEAAFLRQSVFEHMPPTIKFYGKLLPVKKPSPAMKETLIWAHNPLLSNPMRHILRQSHFSIQPIESNNGWLGYWGRHWKTSDYHQMSINQKVNHYPGSFHIGRKDRIWCHLKEFMRRFGAEFDFMPKTFLMPDDLEDLIDYLSEDEGNAVIVKPPASARGAGITIVSNPEELPEIDFELKKSKYWVAQKYVLNPYLINDKKFDLRIYVYVPSLDPLTIYINKEGLVRFASLPYDNESLSNQYVHLTNYSINRYAERDGMIGGPVDKWTLERFWKHLDSHGKDSKAVLKQIEDMVVKTVISCESYIRDHMKYNETDMSTCHELFGFDILIDDKMRAHLLEVNISPSLQAHTEVDKWVKWALVKDVLNMCRYSFPVSNKLLDNSPGNVTRHCDGNFTLACKEKMCNVIEDFRINMKITEDILHPDYLTGADIRCLCNFEDEYDCRGNLDLIYPSKNKKEVENYFQFIRNPTYFDILMLEWCSQRFNSLEEEKELLNLLHKMCYLGNHIVTDELRIGPMLRYPYVNTDEIFFTETADNESTSS
uniref:ATP-grasp domain-containing protein n=1 Tax=Panagrolaimus sp. PS1159 TaxID=55785 RepID=A0AC35FBA4_9BILA